MRLCRVNGLQAAVLRSGVRVLLVVDPAEKTVTVYQNRDRSIRAYEGAEEIPIEVAGVSVSLTVNTIFEGLC